MPSLGAQIASKIILQSKDKLSLRQIPQNVEFSVFQLQQLRIKKQRLTLKSCSQVMEVRQKLYKQIPKIFHNLSKAKLLLLGQMLRLKLLQIDNLKLLQNI